MRASAPTASRRCACAAACRADPASKTYTDLAITPVVDAEGEALEMFELNDASRAAVEKARRQAQMREAREAVAAGAGAATG